MKTKGSLVTAILLGLGVTAWILSGQFNLETTPKNRHPQYQQKSLKPDTFKVRTRRVKAINYSSTTILSGQTEGSRQIKIRSQASGRIAEIKAREGSDVKNGQVLVKLDPEDRPMRVREASARVKQREIEYAAAEKLMERGFEAKTQHAAAFANLESAKATLKRAKTDLKNMIIRAPFDGVFDQRFVEIGDVLKKSDPIGHLIDLDPLLISAFVSEKNYLQLREGQDAKGRLPDGTILKGKIRYISSSAEPNTRTFKVEMEIPNPKNDLVQGITAEMTLSLPPVPAHRVSAAFFSLNSKGQLGLQTVNEENKVNFMPVQIVGGTDRDIFITGLPTICDIIVVGQGFVAEGQIVKPVLESETSGTKS